MEVWRFGGLEVWRFGGLEVCDGLRGVCAWTRVTVDMQMMSMLSWGRWLRSNLAFFIFIFF